MLSHKYKCIFVHIPKVAGQSIEHVFLDLHELSWETRAPLLLRPNTNSAAGPRRLAHLKASEYVSCGHISQEKFDSYFKFSFVRNPWSRLVSVYNYLGYFNVMPFKQFLEVEIWPKEEWEARLLMMPQYDYLFNDNGEQLVDYIGRFEELQQGFDHVCNEIGIAQTKLPFINKSGAKPGIYKSFRKFAKRLSPFHKDFSVRGGYKEYYDKESRQLVSKKYERDIDTFKYTFDPKSVT